MLTVRQLEIFLEVVRAGSFRQCAARLDVSPISVGEHIKALEQTMETRLFDRRPGGPAILTRAGRLALEHAERIMAEVSEMHRRIAPSTARRPQLLRVHVHPFTAVRARPTLQQHAAEKGIALDLDLASHSPEEVDRMLDERSLDLSVMLTAHWRKSRGVLLHSIRNCLFVGNGHPALKHGPLTRDDVASMTYLALPPGTYTRSIADEVLMWAEVPYRNVAMGTDDLGSMLEALRAHEGFMLGPNNFAQHFGVDLPISPLLLDFELPDMEARLLTRADGHDGPAITELAEWMLEKLRSSDHPDAR